MKFTAKKVDLTLELENVDGYVKKFEFGYGGGIINAKTAEKLGNEFVVFEQAQASLPTSERLSKSDMVARELKMAYPEFDEEWALESFTLGELQEIIMWLANGLAGVKKI